MVSFLALHPFEEARRLALHPFEEGRLALHPVSKGQEVQADGLRCSPQNQHQAAGGSQNATLRKAYAPCFCLRGVTHE